MLESVYERAYFLIQEISNLSLKRFASSFNSPIEPAGSNTSEQTTPNLRLISTARRDASRRCRVHPAQDLDSEEIRGHVREILDLPSSL